MKNKMLWGFLAVFAVSILALAGITYAYRGDPNVNGPRYNAEVHEQLEAAIESGDYDAWLRIRQENNLPTRGRVFQVINEDNFDRYAELHKANQAGDTERAAAIKAELGLGQGVMNRNSGGMMTGRNSAGQNFVDANNDGICDNGGRMRN